MVHRECEQTIIVEGVAIRGWLEQDPDCSCPLGDDGELKLFERGRMNYNHSLLEQYQDDPLAFPIERYEHGLVHYGLRDQGDYPDREWDVSFAGYFILGPNLIEDHAAYKQDPWDTVTPEERLQKQITHCLQEYSDWCNGNCWGWVIEVDGEDRDSCWGYVGQEYAEERLKEELAEVVEAVKKERQEAKQWEIFHVTG